MRYHYFIYFALACLQGCDSSAQSLNPATAAAPPAKSASALIDAVRPNEQRKKTPAGELVLDAEAKTFRLNGAPILTVRAQDHYGMPFRFYIEDWQQLKEGSDIATRLVVAENSECTQQFIIIDLTGAKPHVTNRFGYNPEGKFCLHYKGAKWGRKASKIYFRNGATYWYDTGGEVVGPI